MRERARPSDRDFDFTDGPTELPGPWTPPPDPDFATGTVPLLEAVDLAAGLDPRVEPSDSVQATIRFSREEMQSLIAARLDARDTDPAPPPPVQRTELITPLPARPAPGLERRAEVLPPREPEADEREGVLQRLLDRRYALPHLLVAFAIGVLTGLVAMR